ncbi:MAG: DUF493 domain-containing protein [Pseudomonadota bacterium]|nr:DUF493 domain-containing protein [Pseudomonadota bacterium]
MSALLTFPCQFPIKVVGYNTPEFEVAVLTIFRKHVHDLGESAISQKQSKNNRYLSITAVVNATSQEQLDALYQDLSESTDVLFAL